MRHSYKESGASRKNGDQVSHANELDDSFSRERHSGPYSKILGDRKDKSEYAERSSGADVSTGHLGSSYDIQELCEKMKMFEEKLSSHKIDLNKRINMVEEKLSDISFTVNKALNKQYKPEDQNYAQQERIRHLEDKVGFLEERFMHDRKQQERGVTRLEPAKEHIPAEISSINHTVTKCVQNQQDLQYELSTLKKRMDHFLSANTTNIESGGSTVDRSDYSRALTSELKSEYKPSDTFPAASGSLKSSRFGKYEEEQPKAQELSFSKDRELARTLGFRETPEASTKSRKGNIQFTDNTSRDDRREPGNADLHRSGSNLTTNINHERRHSESRMKDLIHNYLPAADKPENLEPDNRFRKDNKSHDFSNTQSIRSSNYLHRHVSEDRTKNKDHTPIRSTQNPLKSDITESRDTAIQKNKAKIQEDIENLKRLVNREKDNQQRSRTADRVRDFDYERPVHDDGTATRNRDTRAVSQVRWKQYNGEDDLEYATFRNEPTRTPEDLTTHTNSDFAKKATRDELYQDIQNKRRSLDEVTASILPREENHSPMAPTGLDEIHVKARLIEEKKKKIDREIEKRIQEENDRRKRLGSQGENMRKTAEKQGDETFKHTPFSTEKSREKQTKSRLDLEKKMRDDVIGKYTGAVKSFSNSKKLERKNL